MFESLWHLYNIYFTGITIECSRFLPQWWNGIWKLSILYCHCHYVRIYCTRVLPNRQMHKSRNFMIYTTYFMLVKCCKQKNNETPLSTYHRCIYMYTGTHTDLWKAYYYARWKWQKRINTTTTKNSSFQKYVHTNILFQTVIDFLNALDSRSFIRLHCHK